MPNPIIYDITPKPNDQGDQITIHGSHFIQPNYNYVTPVSAWWPLDGNLNDSTGNGHTLTAVGGSATYVPGFVLSAVSLDGTYYLDSDITMVDVLSASPPWTEFVLSFYFSPQSSGTCACLFSMGDDTIGIEETMSLYYNTSAGITLEWSDSAKTSAVNTTVQFPPNIWYEANIKSQAGGVSVGVSDMGLSIASDITNSISVGSPRFSATNTNTLKIGARKFSGTASNYFTGLIDDFAFFGSACNNEDTAKRNLVNDNTTPEPLPEMITGNFGSGFANGWWNYISYNKLIYTDPNFTQSTRSSLYIDVAGTSSNVSEIVISPISATDVKIAPFSPTLSLSGFGLSASEFALDGETITAINQNDTSAIFNTPNKAPGTYILSAF